MQRQPFWISLGVLAVLLLVLITYRPQYQYRGSVIEQSYLAPEINLTDSSEEPFILSEQHGKIVLLTIR